MPTYISLMKLTDQGIRNFGGAPNRMQQWEQRTRDLGGSLTVWVTMGEYDEVVVWQAPDDATVARMLLALGAEGNVRTTTLRAFSPEEVQQILPSQA